MIRSRRISRRAALRYGAAAAVLAAAPAAFAQGSRLSAPFDVADRRALLGGPARSEACGAAPAAVRDIPANTFYSDRESSIVDAERLARNQSVVKPIRDFEARVVRLTDSYLRSRPVVPGFAVCALDWLDAWASAGALLGEVTSQGAFERKWTLAALALSYLKLRDEPALEATKRVRVETWLSRLAAAMRPPYERATAPGNTSARNNHAYWAGLAAAAAAVAVGDRALLDWGAERFRLGVSQVAVDGTLPLELARRSKALQYHLFSLAPLTLTAEIAWANGIDLYREHDRALERLMRRTVAGLADPAFFERATGEKQGFTGGGGLGGWHLAWAEPWYARFRTPELVPWLTRFRPLRQSWLGGDLTLAYGVIDLPAR